MGTAERAERWPQTGGDRERVDGPATAVVVGGGLAGVAAATVLAERGVAVTVVEREPYLGGRVGAWDDTWADGTPFQMERGFHAFFRQYYNLRALLRRYDPQAQRLVKLEDYPLLGPHGARETFRDLPRTTPWNVIELVRRTPRIGLRDLARVGLRPALAMVAYDPEHTFRTWDGTTAKDYLDSLRFPPEARRLLFDVFAHSFFNPEEGMSAADLLMMFHFYFLGNPEGLVFDVLDDPFSTALWAPLRRYLERLGVRFRLGTAARRLARLPGGAGASGGAQRAGWRVTLDGGAEERGDVVVLAVEVPALQAIVRASDDLAEPVGAAWRDRIDGLAVTLPFAVWRLLLDRPLARDREAFAGTTGFGSLDNVSRYEVIEHESRRWAARTGGSVVELHAYAVPEDADPVALRADLLYQLHALYPETRSARILDDRFLLRRDCPAFAPGSNATRPGVETPFDGLAIAGDFARLPFPSALMERAVSAGFLAANHLGRRWSLRPEEVWSVPRRGVLASWLVPFLKS